MTQRHYEKGFTLLELLLVTGVAAVLLVGLTKMTQSWVDSELATGSGQHLGRVAMMVEKYVEANFDTLDNTDNIVASATDPASPWRGLADSLTAEGLLVGNIIRNPLGVNLNISYSHAAGSDTYNAAVYATSAVPNPRVRAAARQAGNYGGSVMTFPNANNAVGAFGQWSVNKNSLIPSGTGFPCAVTQLNGCLVARISYTRTTLTGPYLFRNEMPDDPTRLLNTMYTDLLMNGNDIKNANTVDTVDLTVSDTAMLGATTIGDTAIFNGPTSVNDGLTVMNGMNVSGDSNFSGNLTMDTATLNADTLNTNTLTAPEISTETLEATNLEIKGGNLVVDDSININGNVVMTSDGSEIMAGTINAGQIDANNGVITAGSVDIRNTMEITGAVSVGAGPIITDRLVSDECVMIDDGTGAGTYDKFGAGCPP